jgi:hypothetical protein
MLLTLLTLITIFLIDRTLGKAFDSQRNKEDVFRKDLRGMQRAKELLSSDQANFYTNPQKSESNDSSAFKRFSVPIPNDGPASTISSFLSELTVVPTSSSLHFHVPNDIPAITTSSFKQLNVPTIATLIDLRTCDNSLFFYFDTITATSTAKSTYVSATTTAQMNSSVLNPATHATSLFLLRDEDKSETMTLSLLLPFNQDNSAITTATHAQNLLLFFVRNDPAITISSLLLPRDFERPAITTATNGDFSLQLIVESLSTGTDHQVAPATILDDSFKLIDVLASEGATFAPHISEDAFNRANKSSKFAVASQAMVLSTTIGDNSSGSIKPQKLIVIYSK